MLKPRGLGRRRPPLPSQTIPGKKKTHQTKSITFRSPCHCDLFSPVETDSGALSGSFRQNQAVSGRIRQLQAKSGPFQAFSGIFRQNQAESGRIRQNQAKSGNPLDLENHWSGILHCSKSHKLLPLFGQSFFGCIPSKLKRKQTTVKPQAMASFFPRHGNCADKS